MNNFRITKSITDRKDASLKSYFRDVSKLSLISREDEIELTKRVKLGDQKAANDLVKANLRFVISVAKKYQNKGLDLVDLIQEGNLGLIKASQLYDETKGFKFISYAVWWIRQSIIKAISEQCRTVRVPMNQILNMSKVNKFSEKFEQKYDRVPSISEIEENTNLDPKKIVMSYRSTYRSTSLDSPINDDDSSCLLDVIPNENSVPTDSITNNDDISKEIDRVLSKLSYRDSDIIRMSFGIGVQQMSNTEIAKRFGIGNERVRQIQHNSLKKIRNKFGSKLIELL